MPQEINNERELTEKDDKTKEEIGWVDFLDPAILLGSIWRGAKLPKMRKVPRVIFTAFLITGVGALLSLAVFGEQLPSWLHPLSQISDVLITAIILLLIWLFIRIKKG